MSLLPLARDAEGLSKDGLRFKKWHLLATSRPCYVRGVVIERDDKVPMLLIKVCLVGTSHPIVIHRFINVSSVAIVHAT